MAARDDLQFSISYTTRPQRSTEVDGKDYNFVTPEIFNTMIKANDFLEFANVFDNQYGTSRSQVEVLLNKGHNVILEIDWQGAQQVREHMPDCRSIFILPPSVGELKKRLTGRGTDSAEVIERRFRDAVDDMSHWTEFDYAVVNKDLEAATAELISIVVGEGEACRTTDEALQTSITAILAS